MTPESRAAEFDAADPLAPFRDRFTLPQGVLYLDGNSLGALPKATPEAVRKVLEQEWGEGLIRSWNGAGWFEAAGRVGAKIAPLIGAAPYEVIACDSTSVNLFKLIAAALQMRPGRKVVLSEPGNFPTDLYMIAGLEALGLAERRLSERGRLAEALDGDVALLLLTHIHYKTGAMHDMAALTHAAHKAGALVLWDLSHSTGALPINLNEVDADFAVRARRPSPMLPHAIMRASRSRSPAGSVMPRPSPSPTNIRAHRASSGCYAAPRRCWGWRLWKSGSN